MGLDRQKLNTIYNQLKELVGDRGAFAIFVTTPVKDSGSGEDIRIETFGPITTLNGLLGLGTQYLGEALEERMDKIIKPIGPEPD